MLDERTDRQFSFYKLKISEGLTQEEALERVKTKFSPTPYDLARLAERTQASDGGEHK
jgi:hypothetical protein